MSAQSPPPPPKRGTIRFEDLGEPIQRLLRSVKEEDLSEDDYELLEYVSVRDMAHIYSEMASDRLAQDIWQDLRAALHARREETRRREADLLAKQSRLDGERAEEQQRLRDHEEEEERERRAEEEEFHRRQQERRERQKEEAQEAEDAARAEQEAAEEAAQREERRLKCERKRKRREARARELQGEQEALEAERARQLAKRNRNQKKDWDDYIDSHPLQFDKESDPKNREITQEKLTHTLNAPPQASDDLLTRTYTPKCPNCGSRYTQPPSCWQCPTCLRREKRQVMVWQLDNDSKSCMCCRTPFGRWSRHHCRNCGRLVCSDCGSNKAIIAALGFHTPVKICDQCAHNRPVAKGW